MDLSQPEKNIAGTEDTLESSFIQLMLMHPASTGIVFICFLKNPKTGIVFIFVIEIPHFI